MNASSILVLLLQQGRSKPQCPNISVPTKISTSHTTSDYYRTDRSIYCIQMFFPGLPVFSSRTYLARIVLGN